MLVLCASFAAACGPLGEDIHDAFNSRDVGPYVSRGRTLAEDGSLVVHVAASRPEHAEQIAWQIVRQNYATSAEPVRVIVDPMAGDGERHVYVWDGRGLAVDTSTTGLPPRAPGADAHGGETAPH